MVRALAAGTLYACALFAIGFALGAIRVLVLAPRVGETVATLAELPLMLAAAFLVCRWIMHHVRVPAATRARLVSGLWFLILLIGLEVLVGTELLGRSPTDQASAMTTASGILGLAAQTIAALFPLVTRQTTGGDPDRR